jgi:hypothetical protein
MSDLPTRDPYNITSWYGSGNGPTESIGPTTYYSLQKMAAAELKKLLEDRPETISLEMNSHEERVLSLGM